MKKSLLVTFILIIHFAIAFAQPNVQVKYFSNESFSKEVSEEKGKFSQTITTHSDGSVTTELKDLKNAKLLRSETWNGKEPTGVWKIQTGDGIEEMDYDFTLVYSQNGCLDSIVDHHIVDPFKSDKDILYKAPILSSGDSIIFPFLAKNLRYPAFARENGIEGRVLLNLTITKTGAIENISVNKGVDVTLDKEAVRVMRKIKFLTPPMLDGKPTTICVRFPITFRLS